MGGAVPSPALGEFSVPGQGGAIIERPPSLTLAYPAGVALLSGYRAEPGLPQPAGLQEALAHHHVGQALPRARLHNSL